MDLFQNNMVLSFYSIMILVIFLYFTYKYKYQKTVEQTLFKYLIISNIVMNVLDVLSRFDGLEQPYFAIFNQIGNYLVFILTPLLPLIWTLYVNYRVNLSKRKLNQWISILLILFAINLVFATIAISRGLYYTINEQNIYERGPLYVLSFVYAYGLMIFSMFYIIKNQSRIDKRQFKSLIAFVIPPVFASIIHIFFYGYSLIYNSITISILLVFIDTQANQMEIDYLTNVFNRKKLQQHLVERINNASKEHSFAASMIDLDNFKQINDTYGHTEGDIALQVVAQLLKDATSKDALIARYGGDEFCIVIDIDDEDEIKQLNQAIEHRVQSYNALGLKPYLIEFSIGYEVFDKEKHQNANAFIDVLDQFMYQDKEKKKN
ncbi:GGDEF domain-containing protein [Paracholeplasma brassicae]|nr:GGDEF domain-containing protein [Paracholeplasma brassicae]